MTPDLPRAASARQRRVLRWAGLVGASILLHLLALQQAGGWLHMPDWRAPAPEAPVIVAQLKAPSPPKPAAAPAPKRPTPARQARPARPKAPQPVPIAEAATQARPADQGIRETVIALPPQRPLDAPFAALDALAAEHAPSGSDARPAPQDTSKEKLAASPQDNTPFRVDPPPSAELKYDVQALRGGETVYGSGKIRWQTEGDRYTVIGEASILFFTLLNFRSEGMLDDFGVAPVLYSEKRFRRSATNTHFHRERNTISFSASEAQYPRKGGEQDRASLIWQLVGIGRGDSTRFAPDAEIDLFVAGVRDAETWRLRIVGLEQIEINGETMPSWHIVRTPRPGSYEQRLDIWLAPERDWYPVKLRYTENNGDYLDLLLSKLNLLNAKPGSSSSP